MILVLFCGVASAHEDIASRVDEPAFAVMEGQAQAPKTAKHTTPFVINLWPELSLTVATLGIDLVLDAWVERSAANPVACPRGDHEICRRQSLSALDRAIIGNHDRSWNTASDIVQWSSLGLPMAINLVDNLYYSATPATDFGVDTLVFLEAVAAAQMSTHLLKYAVRRPRPAMYLPPGQGGVQGQIGFPSGHTSHVAAASTAFATAFALRHPQSPWRFMAVGTGVVMTTLVGTGRVAAGKHFVTDVLAGAILGAAIGFAVPYLHKKKVVPKIIVTHERDGDGMYDLGGHAGFSAAF